MRAIVFGLAVGIVFLGLVAPASAQQVTPVRVWVSAAKGVDAAGCAVTSNPCRTFAFALTQIAAGGEIDVMDAGGYGSVVINKAVTIINDSAGAATVSAISGNDAITISAGASDKVYLKGITVDGAGTGRNGIVFNSGGALTITDCSVRRFNYTGDYHTGNGIYIAPTASLGSLTVRNTVVSDNGFTGVYILPASGATAVTAVIENLTAVNNYFGFAINLSFSTGGTSNISIFNSTFSKNQNEGVYFYKGNVNLNAVLKGNRILYNGSAYFNSTTSFTSYGGNTIVGNTNASTGSAPTAASDL